MSDKETKKTVRSKKTSSKKTTSRLIKDQEELSLLSKEEKLDEEQHTTNKEDNVQKQKQEYQIEGITRINSDYLGNYSDYLSASINLPSFLSDSLLLNNRKIIPSIEVASLLLSLNRISGIHKSLEQYEKKFKLISIANNKEIQNLGIILFGLFSNEKFSFDFDTYYQNFYNLCTKCLFSIDKIKEGEKSLDVVLQLLRDCPEISSFPKLHKYIDEYKPNQFSQLNDIAENIISLLNETKLDDKYLLDWKTVIWALLWVFRYSTQSSEILIEDLMKKKGSHFKELHVILISLFVTRLFHYAPSWKPIGLSYQLPEKMKVLQPAAEVFYNPSIITSLSSDTKKQEEYFWTYVWGKPYSMFEKPEVKTVTKYQKKMIEAEEEVIVEEKTFGDFITISGDPKPTGAIRIKAKV